MREEFIENPFEGKYRYTRFTFAGMTAYIVFPPDGVGPTGRWLLKTVYYGAFPQLEMDMLDSGYHLAYVDSAGRWGRKDDLKRQKDFCSYVASNYGLNTKCVLIGMSAGGYVALKLAAYYPEIVEAMYLDAACVNIFSCPLGFGKSVTGRDPAMTDEICNYLGYDRYGILAYRDAPIDHLDKLKKARIPAVIAYGTADRTVPYEENGIYIEHMYRENGIPLMVVEKPGCDHHPHGVPDSGAVISFLRQVLLP